MKYSAALLVLFLVMTCGIVEFLFPVNYPQRYIENELNNNELVGTWKITPESVSRIEAYIEQQDEFWPISPTPWKSITLSQNGSCEVELENSWTEDNSVLNEQDALPTCTWKIRQISGYAEEGASKKVTGLLIRFEHYDQLEDKYYVYSTESYIVVENNELVIWNFIGDPSFLRYQDFHKIN